MRFILFAGVSGFVAPFPRATSPAAPAVAQLVQPSGREFPGGTAYYYDSGGQVAPVVRAPAPGSSAPAGLWALVGASAGFALVTLAVGGQAKESAKEEEVSFEFGDAADEEVSFEFGDAADMGTTVD